MAHEDLTRIWFIVLMFNKINVFLLCDSRWKESEGRLGMIFAGPTTRWSATLCRLPEATLATKHTMETCQVMKLFSDVNYDCDFKESMRVWVIVFTFCALKYFWIIWKFLLLKCDIINKGCQHVIYYDYHGFKWARICWPNGMHSCKRM